MRSVSAAGSAKARSEYQRRALHVPVQPVGVAGEPSAESVAARCRKERKRVPAPAVPFGRGCVHGASCLACVPGNARRGARHSRPGRPPYGGRHSARDARGHPPDCHACRAERGVVDSEAAARRRAVLRRRGTSEGETSKAGRRISTRVKETASAAPPCAGGARANWIGTVLARAGRGVCVCVCKEEEPFSAAHCWRTRRRLPRHVARARRRG